MAASPCDNGHTASSTLHAPTYVDCIGGYKSTWYECTVCGQPCGADRTAAVRRTAVGDGGIGHSDVGIVAQQQCAAVGSGAADGAALGGFAVDDIDVALNGQGGFAADARNGMTRQIQRDIGVLADLGAGVGIGQQLDSQLLVGILRQHGAGGIHSLLQAVVGGFAEPIAKELPLEYAVEMNNLIRLEMKGSIG